MNSTPDHLDYEKRVATTEAERIAITSAKLAVNDAMNELFASLGVNRANFESMQELRDDLAFVKSLRRGSVKAGVRVFFTLLAIITTAFAWGMWQAFKSAVTGVH